MIAPVKPLKASKIANRGELQLPIFHPGRQRTRIREVGTCQQFETFYTQFAIYRDFYSKVATKFARIQPPAASSATALVSLEFEIFRDKV